MPYNNPQFPSQVWDGLTSNLNRIDLNSNVDPNSDDWERIAAEVIAAQTYSLTLGGTNVQTVTASSDTLIDTDHTVLCDCTSNAITINLPAAVASQRFEIKKIDATVNTVTVDANGSETIDGTTTSILTSQYESITIVCDGSNWFII